MGKYFILLLLHLSFIIPLYAQSDTLTEISGKTDTAGIHPLNMVIVKAYEQNRNLLETPAAVNIIGEKQLQQFDNTSILPAVNATPGVRMEERSPGSYRFGIRGSSLESPFGVRNVKVYYNDIPFTGPSGNTYLNQLGFYNIQNIEIIKGPAGSLYGAGTGGVLLINSMPAYWQQGVSVNYTGGSYNLSSAEAEIRIGDSAFKNVIRYQHISSDGYRQQSALTKDVFSWDGTLAYNKKGEVGIHFLYGNLNYQTPGGLTISEYQANPQQARPLSGATPGAVQSNAAIYQKMFLAGFSYKQQFNDHFQNITTLYGDYTQMLNPNLRNYSRSMVPNYGGRTLFKYETNGLQAILGAEAQADPADNKTYQNLSGTPSTLLADQEIDNNLISAFMQITWQVKSWIFTGGLSINRLQVKLQTLGSSYMEQNRIFSNQTAPRLAALKEINKKISFYANIEKGFSPPSIDELAPTGSQVNFNLNAEQGWNYEIGMRGYAISRLFFDVSVFYLSLQDAIVQRRDSAGGDFYLNAGSTEQTGIEAALNYELFNRDNTSIGPCYINLSYTGNYFRYNKFRQLDKDYSGKRLPGIAPNTFSAGISLNSKFGLYLNLNYFFSDRIPLNDANTAYAAPYNLLGCRLGYKHAWKKYLLDIYTGADNLLNQTYSLGNDINAAGARYYNAAPPINFFAGLSLSYLTRK